MKNIEKWCINRRKLSPAQNKEVNKFFNKQTHDTNFKGKTGIIHFPMCNRKFYYDSVQPGYVELSEVYLLFMKRVYGLLFILRSR